MRDVCPVCNRAGLQVSALTCPQCNADLECFRLLDALHGREEGAEVVEGRATGSKGRLLLWMLVGLIGAGWALDRWQLLLRLDAVEARGMTTGKETCFADHWIVLEQGIVEHAQNDRRDK